MLSSELLRHRAEVARALRSHKYDHTPEGIYIPGMKADVGFTYESWLNHAEHQVHRNLLTLEGRNLILNILMGQSAVVAPWYGALFEGDVEPASNWIGGPSAGGNLNFNAVATEFTDYDETLRPAFVEAAASAGSISNTASKMDFTISEGVVNKDLYGGALLSVATKESTTGYLLSASLFTGVRRVNATDILTVGGTLSLTSS